MERRLWVRGRLAEGDGPAAVVVQYMSVFEDAPQDQRKVLVRQVRDIAKEDAEEVRDLRDEMAAAVSVKVPLADKTVRLLKMQQMADLVMEHTLKRFGSNADILVDADNLDAALSKTSNGTSRSLRDCVETWSGLVQKIKAEMDGYKPLEGGGNVYIERYQQLNIESPVSDDELIQFSSELARRAVELDVKDRQ